MTVKLQSAADMAKCICGRGKEGWCDGSHSFTDEQWAEYNLEFDSSKFQESAGESWLKKVGDDDWMATKTGYKQ